mmetsp:Transcript_67789/g.126601  ORF Transcript_67789/g.126601 Transcript_67789/m.126601 type:complete len:95 (-) Transcript_67789:396-680(-)
MGVPHPLDFAEKSAQTGAMESQSPHYCFWDGPSCSKMGAAATVTTQVVSQQVTGEMRAHGGLWSKPLHGPATLAREIPLQLPHALRRSSLEDVP